MDGRFQLNYAHDTLAILVINTPSTFEKLFLPYLFANYHGSKCELLDQLSDPIDEIMGIKFAEVKQVRVFVYVLLNPSN